MRRNFILHNMKNLIYILPLFILACKPQKSVVEYKYLTKTDTLIRTQTNTVYQAVNDTTFIPIECDSAGILNQFYAKISIPFGTVIAQRKGRGIKLSVKTDPLLSRVDSTYKSKDAKVVSIKEKEVIKYRIPSWIIYTVIVETLLIALYVYLRIKKLLLI